MIYTHFLATAAFRVCFFFGLAWIANAQDARQYKIVNGCPSTVAFYIGGAFDSNLATGASTTKTLGANAGFFYVFANGGNTIGTRAGFYGDNNASSLTFNYLEDRETSYLTLAYHRAHTIISSKILPSLTPVSALLPIIPRYVISIAQKASVI